MSAAATFLGLPEERSTFEESRVLVLPIPYDGTTSYRPGTRFGPAAILDASAYVETWDEELGIDVAGLGYHLLPEIETEGLDVDSLVDRIYETSASVLDRAGDRFLLSLGGEHSVTPGIVRAFAERYDDLSVLHIDAHADLRADYEGSRNSHACACRRIRDYVTNTVSVGIRSLSAPEARLIEEEKIPIFWARDVAGRTDWIEEAVDLLSDHVYLTVDLDGLDPSILPGTGTPEPGGLGWYETLALFRETARRKKIVGADVVELAPIEGHHASDFLAARLALKIVVYALEKEVRSA